MTDFILNIANYNIKIKSADFDLVPGKRFRNFQAPPSPGDPPGGLIAGKGIPPCPPRGGVNAGITIFRGPTELPSGSISVFHAPFVEEAEGTRAERDPEFWSIWKNENVLFIKTTYPLSPGNKKGLLKFSLNANEWELWIDAAGEKSIDPLEYPLDGLILYYLSVINGDIMIHASGVNHNGKGYIFSGVSGKGKTTMSALWKNAGSEIIHDDRLILRKTDEGFKMYNTPVYDDEKPSESIIDGVFIIEHGRENTSVKLNGASAVTAVMANCIQHNWGQDTISSLLMSVNHLCSEVPVCRLSFKPDKSIIDHIING